MSDNIRQESTESLQTKEQEQQAGSNKRTLEAENDKAAKKAFKEKKKNLLHLIKNIKCQS